VNFVIPSLAVLVVIGFGELQLRVGLKGGAEPAVIVMSNTDEKVPSVRVNVAVPDDEKVTAKGVLILEVVIFAPVNTQETVVVGDIFVTF
jgi:hypothetical protein